MIDLCQLSLEQLHTELKKFEDKINGPENDGRITANGSASLDYWMDMVEEIKEELQIRKGVNND